MNNDIEMLKREISQLRKEIDNMKIASNIPFEIDSAFQNRGFTKTEQSEATSFDMTSNAGFRQTLSLTGGAEDIVVPAFPVRWKRLSDGSNLYIPLHAFSELY